MELTLLAGSAIGLLTALALGTLVVFRAETKEKYLATLEAEYPALSRVRSETAELEAKRDSRREEILDLDARLADLRREQAETERQSLDAQHWRALVDQAKRDYETLEDKIAEVDRVKDEYEAAKNDLAAKQAEVDELLRKRDELKDQIGDIEARRTEAEELNREIENKEKALTALKGEISNLNDQRDAMHQARFEVDQLARRKETLDGEIAYVRKELDPLKKEKSDLEKEVNLLRAERDRLKNLRAEVDDLTARKSALEVRVAELRKEKEKLDGDRPGITAAQTASGLTKQEAAKAVEDLWQRPACLFDGKGAPILKDRRAVTSEQDAISGVSKYLNNKGLRFDEALIKRFHTSLKIGRISPLTVLAGISGTGKSLLPQCYAEAMGIPFLKAAVQPRWDSPQDLLGFYNYLEKRYKATEFARALAYMDTNSLNADRLIMRMNDRLLLILLDEMNLARIEYYFSEFLSRLEGRPAPDITEEVFIRPSRIEIDVPLSDGTALSIYPGHNLLFAGTMNEDESTQALSDKVLDRGNVIRFKRPDKLVTRAETQAVAPRSDFLTFDAWRSWYRPELAPAKRQRLDEHLNTLNEYLEALGRPFGHRVYQAIYAFAANHPDVDDANSEDRSLADMLTMRILPKLRGIDLGAHGQEAVNRIADLVEKQLDDQSLADAIKGSIGDDGLFTWRG